MPKAAGNTPEGRRPQTRPGRAGRRRASPRVAQSLPIAPYSSTAGDWRPQPDSTPALPLIPQGAKSLVILREIIGKTEWTETLKARMENEAIRLMQPHIAETDRVIALAEAGNWPPIPDEDIDVVYTAWKHAEPVATIASADIRYSVERFLAGPRELRFEVEYQIGDRMIRWVMPSQTRKAISAILDDPGRIAAFRRTPGTLPVGLR